MTSRVSLRSYAEWNCRDPKDNQFLELAESANAEMILSSDAGLAVLHPWRGIPILPPSAFLVGVH